MDEIGFGWRSALLLVAALHLLVSAVLLVRRDYDRMANRLLAALLLVVVGILTPQIIGFAGFYDAFPWLSFAPFANDLLIGPLILGYAFALTTGRVPGWAALLLIPAAADFAYNCFWFLQPLQTKWDWNDAWHVPFYIPVRDATGLILALIGLIGAGRLYLTYRSRLRDFSSAATEFDPRWLAIFLGVMGGLVALWTGVDLAEAAFGPFSYFEAFPVFLLLAAVMDALALTALQSHRTAFPKPGPAPDADESEGRDWAADAASLRARIISEDWHLEPRLTITDLARRIGTNESYLSRTINRGADVNFNRFINTIRVEAVKIRLADGAPDVLEAALDSGFNSKATFNRVFRDITGETPAAFRASQKP